ncbi:MAG: hypothetical protein HOL77_09600 [Rhodobacteraceae bacterium]|jgi:hypothetical protein|nr:hypothetical protein [Paracoccaceae bacterium]
MNLWALGFLVGLAVVLVVALLLIGILLQARRIHGLAKTAAAVVGDIDSNTRSVWSLATTNEVAKGLLGGAQSIDENAAAIVAAVSHEDQNDSAA